MRFFLRVLNRRYRGGDLDVLAPGLPDGVEGLSSAILVSDLLRSLIGRWIESGMSRRSANGKTARFDSPSERTPWKEVLEDFFKRNPPQLVFRAEGPGLLVLPDINAKREAPPSWLAAQFESALQRELQRSGSRGAWQVREMLPRLAPMAADIAVSLYLQWMDTPERAKLSRCDGCGAHFMRSRRPSRKMPIKNGSWCRRCQAKGARLRVAKGREGRRDLRVGLAADAWPRWKPDRHPGTQAEWVAMQVNDRLGTSGSRIAKNWVTWHKDEIEAEVERRRRRNA